MASFDIGDEPLEQAAERAAAAFVDIYRGLETRRVAPEVTREQLDAALAGSAEGDEGIGLLAALDEFRDTILPGCMGTAHPLYLGLVNCSPLPGAAIADLLISSLNNNGGTSPQSPSMSACERQVVRAFARRFGLPEDTPGMFLPGGTFANLQSLVLARARACPGPVHPGLRLYASQAAHFSISRSATVMGLGPESVVAVATTGRGAMDPDDLRARIDRDVERGHTPFAVVATAGTTGTGAIDPLAEIGGICRDRDLWFHADACYGGAAVLVPELRERFAGIELADSVSVDPHKWFYIPVTAALFLTRHQRLASEVFAAESSSYIPTETAAEAWQWGLPTTRRSSGFTVWMALRAHGWRAIRDSVARNVELSRRIERGLSAAGFDVLEGGELSVACARWVPDGCDPESADALQTKIAASVADSGRAWFSTVRHDGRTWLRFNMVNLHTRAHHIDQLVDIVVAAAGSLSP